VRFSGDVGRLDYWTIAMHWQLWHRQRRRTGIANPGPIHRVAEHDGIWDRLSFMFAFLLNFLNLKFIFNGIIKYNLKKSHRIIILPIFISASNACHSSMSSYLISILTQTDFWARAMNEVSSRNDSSKANQSTAQKLVQELAFIIIRIANILSH
jgi:hypothetical protein